MKKIKLEIETLEIVSFDTAPAAREDEGTVLAHATKPNQFTCGAQTCANTCAFQNTCIEDCYLTVYQTCTCPVELETRFCDTSVC